MGGGWAISTTLSVQFWGIKYIALLYNHPYHLSPEVFHLPKQILSPLNTNCPFPSPAPGSRHPLLSLSLMTLGTSCEWHPTLSCWYWLLSPSMGSAGFICCRAHIGLSFLFMAESYSIVRRDHTAFIHPSADPPLGSCEQCYGECGRARISSSPCFRFG